jgi:hypothetical protein
LAIVMVTLAETPSLISPVGSQAMATIPNVPSGMVVVSHEYGFVAKSKVVLDT